MKTIPKELSSLKSEVSKYSNPEDFIEAQQNKQLDKFDENTISDIQSDRHNLHSLSTKDIYNTNSSSYGKMDNYIDSIADSIKSLNITGNEKDIASKIRNYSNSEGGDRPYDIDLDYDDEYQDLYSKTSDDDLSEQEQEEAQQELDDYRDNHQVLAESSIHTEKEKINLLVEDYLDELDKKWDEYELDSVSSMRGDTTFKPTGFARARSILGEGSNNTATEKNYKDYSKIPDLLDFYQNNYKS